MHINGYKWETISTTNANPACYSPTNRIIIGADTWYCANGTLAYYNVPWWTCREFNTCPTPAWTLSSDGDHCSIPNPSCPATSSTVSEPQLLAAIVYGEASVNSTFEEKAAIANAIIRKRNAMGFATVNELIVKRRYYSANPSIKPGSPISAISRWSTIEFRNKLYVCINDPLSDSGQGAAYIQHYIVENAYSGAPMVYYYFFDTEIMPLTSTD